MTTLQRGPYILLHLNDIPRFGTGATAYIDCVVWEWINFRCQAESRNGTYERDGVVWWRASLEALAGELHLTKDVVRRSLDRLRDSGLLEAVRHMVEGGYDRTYSYRPHVASVPHVHDVASVPHVPLLPKEERTKGISDETSSDFLEFWNAYLEAFGSKKSGPKKTAEAKYRIARRSVDQKTLLEALQAYRLDLSKEEWKSPTHAATWLHQERWTMYEPESAEDVIASFLAAHDGKFSELERATGIRCMTPEFGELEFQERREAVKAFRDAWLDENRDRLAEALR